MSRGTITLHGLEIGDVRITFLLDQEDHEMFEQEWQTPDSADHPALSNASKHTTLRYPWQTVKPKLQKRGAWAAGQYVYRRSADTFGPPQCIFITHKGWVGAASKPINIGDTLCFLQGCKLPVVLRKQDSEPYRIVDAVRAFGLDEEMELPSSDRYTETDLVIG